MDLPRRTFLPMLSAALASAGSRTIGLNAGTYSMKSLPAKDALQNLADIGYDGVEIALMPGWPTDPAVLSAGDRREIRSILQGSGLALPSLMESLPMNGTEGSRSHNRERLKLAAALAHDLAPGKLPVVETVLGGKTTAWEQTRNSMAEELTEWARVAKDGGITLCFKAHVDQAADVPERALWLLNQVQSPHIRLIYDYSHFFLQGLALEETVRQLLPYTSYIAIKDAAGDRNQHHFLLAGEGGTDYVAYLRLLQQLGYGGFVGVEVSSQIHSKPGYDAVATARLCYQRVSEAFRKAGVPRPARA